MVLDGEVGLMSIISWRNIYMPRTALSAASDVMTSLDFCLRKWRGLKVENLFRHSCRVSDRHVIDQTLHAHDLEVVHAAGVSLGTDTCPLCINYYEDDGDPDDPEK